MSQGIQSLFIAEAWGGFDFNKDERWAPGRALKGGPNAYVCIENKERGTYERYETPNMWLCLIDVAACMLITERKRGMVDWISAVNLVHLHELCHACDEGDSKRYDKGRYSHTFYWSKTLAPLSQIETIKRSE